MDNLDIRVGENFAVLFDQMGPVIPLSFPDWIAEHAHTPEIMEEISKITGKPVDYLRESFRIGPELAAQGKKADPRFMEYIVYDNEAVKILYQRGELKATAEDGIEEKLAELDDNRTLMFMFTSGLKDGTRAILDSAKVGHYFKEIYSANHMGKKNDPASYNKIADEIRTKYGISKADIIYVTDTINEAVASVKAGYGAVYYLDLKKEQPVGRSKDGYFVIHDRRDIAKGLIKNKNAKGSAAKAKT